MAMRADQDRRYEQSVSRSRTGNEEDDPVLKDGSGSVWGDSRSARHLTRRAFLKASGGAVLGVCGLAPLASACGNRVDTSLDTGYGSMGCGTTGLWYEDNNMGTAGGAPPDFQEKFYRPDTWVRAREVIDVYYVRSSTLLNPANELDDSFLEKFFVPVLEESGVKIAIDAVGANFLNRRLAGTALADRELRLIEKLRAMGGQVEHIALQSVLSKPLREGGQVVEYPVQRRIQDVVEYAKMARGRLPDVEIGIIDALPSKGLDYQGPYGELAAALGYDLKLDFIHLDCPYERAQEGENVSWEGIKAAESFIKRDIATRFGLISTSRTGGETSDETWNDNVLDVPHEYAKAGGNPDEYAIMSWFPYPSSSIPEEAGPGLFPDTKTVLSFARELGRC